MVLGYGCKFNVIFCKYSTHVVAAVVAAADRKDRSRTELRQRSNGLDMDVRR